MPDSPVAPVPASSGAALRIALVTCIIGLAWRALLLPRYFGHEEEDWGNAQLARGVVESGFRWVELEHMPGFTWLVAALSIGIGDAELAGRVVAMSMGVATVALTALLAARWFDAPTGWIAGLIVAFQPEAALYATTPLRESTYTAATLLGILWCGERRWALGAVVLSLAFLVRFNVAFSLLPALVLAALFLWRRGDRGAKGAVGAALAAALVATATTAWSIFYRAQPEGGTLRFWAGVVDRNTGGAVADLNPIEHAVAVAYAVGGLLLRVVPEHAGPAALPCAALGAILLLRAAHRGDEVALRRAFFALCALGTMALLVATAAFTTYEWFHNLYWKWLTPSVPFLAVLAVPGARALLGVLTWPSLRRAMLAALMLSSAGVFAAQTRRQIEVSSRLYAPQVLAARWVEAAFPEEVTVIADGIPASVLLRRQSGRVVRTWHEVEATEATLGTFLFEHQVAVVFWFRDPWFGAWSRAPALAKGRRVQLGPVWLEPVAWSHEYGMIAYVVDRAHGVAPPATPPPSGVWFPPPDDSAFAPRPEGPP